MSQTSPLFYELIQAGIGKRDCLSHTPTAEQWRWLFEAAIKQAVVGICFYGISRAEMQPQLSHLPLPLKMKWLAMAVQIRQKNEVMNSKSVELQNMLKAAGFRSVILKGQGVAALYHTSKEVPALKTLSLYRQSGDIDVWLDGSREKVIRYAVSIKPTRDFDQKHVHFDYFDPIPVELHWIPVYKWNPRWNTLLRHYFTQQKERQFRHVGAYPHYPTIEFQLTHQLLHVFGHFIGSGVGMRQIMDLYFAQTACIRQEPEKIAETLSLFKKMGLMKFVAATQWVLCEIFMTKSEASTWLICEPNERDGRTLLEEIEAGGNFGQHDVRIRTTCNSFSARFWRKWEREWRFVRFDTLGTLVMPLMRLRLELWMRKERRRLNV